MMHDKLFDKLCDVLDDMERKEKLSASDIQLIDWATHAKKSMLKVDEMMGGESERAYREGGSNRASNRDSSYRRDRMGRYSRDNYSRNYSREYSRDGDFNSQLEELMENAPDEKTRQALQRMMREM